MMSNRVEPVDQLNNKGDQGKEKLAPFEEEGKEKGPRKEELGVQDFIRLLAVASLQFQEETSGGDLVFIIGQ